MDYTNFFSIENFERIIEKIFDYEEQMTTDSSIVIYDVVPKMNFKLENFNFDMNTKYKSIEFKDDGTIEIKNNEKTYLFLKHNFVNLVLGNELDDLINKFDMELSVFKSNIKQFSSQLLNGILCVDNKEIINILQNEIKSRENNE